MTTLPQTAPIRPQRALPNNQIALPGPGGGLGIGQTAQYPGMNAADAWRVLRSNLWLILTMLCVSGAAGYGLNSWLAARHSRYTSTGLISVKLKSDKGDPDSNRIAGVNIPEIENEQNTQVKLLTHELLISRILQNSDPIRQTEWFKQYVSYNNRAQNVDVEAAKADLLDRLDVTPISNSRLISVQMKWSVPKDCQTIVTEVVQQHIYDQQKKSDEQDIEHTQNLENLKLLYEGQMHEVTDQQKRIAQDLGTFGVQVGPGANSKDYELQQLITEQLRAQSFFGAADAKLKTFVKQYEVNAAPEIEEALQRSTLNMEYRRQMDDINLAYAEILATLGPDHPRTLVMKHRRDAITKTYNDNADDIKARTAELITANLKNDLDAAEQALVRIKERLAAVRSEISTIAKQRNDYEQLQSKLANLQIELDHTKEQQDRWSLLVNNHKWAAVEWATFPDLPDHPSFPKLWVTLPLALMIGLALSLGIAFLREVTDTTVRTPRDIARVGQLTLLGMIPHEDDDPEAAGARLPLAIFEAPHSIIAEQFRQVRTRLQHTASLDTTRSILVTGCSPEDGKTTVACNLAAGLALNGRRILLVDANFRRPELHTIFASNNDIGFGDVLNDLDVFDDVVSETEVPNLSVITAGNKPSNPTELLESQLLVDFIERALEEYDHVIFDSGPLLMVSDSIALAPRVDGVITVVRARGNSRGMLTRMRDELRRLKAEHLGVVLNAVRVQNGGYYNSMIKNYYAYQNR